MTVKLLKQLIKYSYNNNMLNPKNVNRIASSMPLSLHPLVFSESQFVGMTNAKESNVGQEALKNNVILYGIEQYYEMV